ncbi:MAG: hypothetical protein L0H29_00950 [Sinobacteraceae bacterium]|nr:hypothetical protein [Nevskiaceae bacterium]
MIINLTATPATERQRAQGVRDFDDFDPTTASALRQQLAFTHVPGVPSIDQIAMTAIRVAMMAEDALTQTPNKVALVSGPGILLGSLEDALQRRGIQPVYGFEAETEAYTQAVFVSCVPRVGTVLAA